MTNTTGQFIISDAAGGLGNGEAMTDTLHTLNDESPATGLTLTVNGRDWVFTPGAVVALAEATGDRPEASSALIVAGLEAAKLDAGANHVDVFGVPLIVRVTDRRVVIGVDEAEIAALYRQPSE